MFEGWEKNADGSFDLVFGYLNRNYEEEPEIPIGPNNSFSPGPADRGQPTHFYPRRQQFMFKVRVPADFGKQELIWTLTRDGRTEKAVAHLALEWELTEIVYSQNRRGLASDAAKAVPTCRRPSRSMGHVDRGGRHPADAHRVGEDDGNPKPPEAAGEGRGRGRAASRAAARHGPLRPGAAADRSTEPHRSGGHVDALARTRTA